MGVVLCFFFFFGSLFLWCVFVFFFLFCVVEFVVISCPHLQSALCFDAPPQAVAA